MGPAGKIRTNLIGTYVDEYNVTPIANHPEHGLQLRRTLWRYCSSGGATSESGVPLAPYAAHDLVDALAGIGPDAVVALLLADEARFAQLESEPHRSTRHHRQRGYLQYRCAHRLVQLFGLSAAVKLADKLTLRVGCNNILDKDPPVIGTTNLPSTAGNGNTFPQVYDALGRFIFGQVIAQF